MKTVILGIIGFVLAFYFSMNGENSNLYWQWHSFWIVGAGTAAILFMIFPPSLFSSLVRSFRHFVNFKVNLRDHFNELQALSKDKSTSVTLTHPLMVYAQQLWVAGVGQDVFLILFSEKKQELESSNLDVIHGLRNLAKYPPALGMLGTVMGMIDLFSNLDKNKALIGTSLSMAMTSTLFGILISNVLVSPLADRLHAMYLKEQRLNTSIFELILLINGNQPLVLIEEEIKNRAA